VATATAPRADPTPPDAECVYCGALSTELDHVVPGQPDTVPACRTCNASKGGRSPEQWLRDGLLGSGGRGGARPALRIEEAPAEHVRCRDYSAHQSQHRLVWICTACEAAP
jgi:hypothetical protein